MPKTLDHRISKTYDIKPVDKRGNLDVERISRREALIRLKNTRREEKASLMLSRFEENRKKSFKERPVFDISNKHLRNFKRQGTFKSIIEDEKIKKVQTEIEAPKTEVLMDDLRRAESFELNPNISDISETKEQLVVTEDENFVSESVEPEKNADQNISTEEEEKEETPEEVLENFRKTFLENPDLPEVDVEEKTKNHNESQRQEGELWQGEYCVIQRNQLLPPNEELELHSIKIEVPKVEILETAKVKLNSQLDKISAIEEFAESKNLESEIENGKILTKEFVNKEDNFAEEASLNSSIDEQESQDFEKEQISAQQKKEDETSAIETANTEEITSPKEDDEFEKVLQKKSKFNERAIDSKLNAWFDCGVVEPTISTKNVSAIGNEKRSQKVEEVKEEAKTAKVETPEKKVIKFTGKIASSETTNKINKKKKKFFSLNYRKKGEAFHWKSLVAKPMLSFATVSLIAFLAIGSMIFVSYGFQIEENVKVKGEQALSYLDDAKNQLASQDFLSAKTSFASAVEEFEGAQKELDLIGGDMLNVFSTFPILSRISSGKNVVDAGNELTKAAKELSGVIEVLAEIENPFAVSEGNNDKSQETMLGALLVMQEKLKVADKSLVEAEKNLDLVKISDLPEEYQAKFEKIKETLPMILSMIDIFEQNSEIFLELLGHNGPRKYLLLFQNNQEMRATGGFIGSYGVLHISNGKINKLLIEGIYNPDGQLKYNVVPPLPIQKISAGWSTHDANWFPHFPTTAQKVSTFYEYTGGPTVDGIITMTPMVLQRMLAVTGPIEMEEYDTTVNAENFVETTQYEVEVDYDKTENEPKQFIADLAPKIITQLFDAKDPGDASEILEIFSDMLKERNIMLYSTNNDVQSAISKRGWSGEILQTQKDYLMVINSNINGFKTDGVVDENITHSAKIADDGTITNTVKIKRTHNGGDTDYEWWNKVNCDYMRVYVPFGSKLVSVKGQTREINEPLLEYDKLGFERDKDVVREEDSIHIDEETGTRIYEEEGKTVFANWVYVSPKETVEIEYVYELPFKLDTAKNQEAADTYSLLVQKQAGSFGSEFSSNIEYSSEISPIWIYPQNIESKENNLEAKTTLTTDLFFGAVFQKENMQITEAKR